MKKLFLPACVLGLILSSTAGAEPPREASEILKEYHAIKMPVVDQAKVSDPAFYARPAAELQRELQRVTEPATEIDAAYARWAELEALTVG